MAETSTDRQKRDKMIANFLNNDDLNGECFISGELGEVEVFKNNRLVVFPNNMTVAQRVGEQMHIKRDDAFEFIDLNFRCAYGSDVTVTVQEAARIAYLRFLAVRNGLISPVFQASSHNVRFNEAILESNIPEGFFLRTLEKKEDVSVHIPVEVREILRTNFNNIIGCIAYMFRVRGHHWLPDMDEKYRDLWSKCLKGTEMPFLKWQFVAHNALHAIFPDTLDEMWLDAVTEGNVAGALAKRVDSAPAGVAAVKAVYAGAQDLQMAVPGIQARFHDHFVELEGFIDNIRSNRWVGSVNRKFYGAGLLNFDEQKFGAIAAVVRAALETFAPDSPLIRSPALKRVSGNARLTGGIVTRGIATAATDPNLVKRILNIKGGAEKEVTE